MTRQQIIDDSFSAIPNSWETVAPYRKSLKIYFDSIYRGNAVFIETSVFNTGAMGIVCPDHEAEETFRHYADNQDPQWSQQEYEVYLETAMAQYIIL